jgi:hypothetical protein
VPQAHADAQRGAAVHRALEQAGARLEVLAVVEDGGRWRAMSAAPCSACSSLSSLRPGT